MSYQEQLKIIRDNMLMTASHKKFVESEAQIKERFRSKAEVKIFPDSDASIKELHRTTFEKSNKK